MPSQSCFGLARTSATKQTDRPAHGKPDHSPVHFTDWHMVS